MRSLFSVKRLTILSHFVVFVKSFFQKFFGSFSEKSFSILSHLSMFVKNFFRSHFRGTFLSYHNQSRFVKIFFRSVERLTILPRFLPPVNAFFRFFSPFSPVCKICQFSSQFIHICLLQTDNPCICPSPITTCPYFGFLLY